MICAAMAGIQFFVTGGIGGVHKGAEHTMDISADLEDYLKQMSLLSVQVPNQF
ncbi:Pseudouridine 5-phosphate glycosidase [Staphylococcus aureus]|uniref:Pseudouridine 5-phosphate glycosidase n=1 Tax=Staphylococcus aureus TaxID=1280 RepID=A0A380DN29_STAAU|nr:Pseudouridine 5-phosphate glycosidase [Staphylococcus aureus]